MKFLVIVFFLYSNSTLAFQRCQKDMYKTILHNKTNFLNVVVLWFPAKVGSQVDLPICYTATGLPVKRFCNYDRTSANGKWQEVNQTQEYINCTDIDGKCKEEAIQLNYLKKNRKVAKYNNKWKSTNVWESADLQDPCLTNNGLFITRRCVYNAQEFKAEWDEVSKELENTTCIRETAIRESVITFKLNTLQSDMIENKIDYKRKPSECINKLKDLLAVPNTKRLSADIKLSTEILKLITETETNVNLVPDILNITNIIMSTDRETIYKSNSASMCLNTIDKYFNKMAEILVPTKNCKTNPNSPNGVYQKIYGFASLFYINPSCSNISGIALYNSEPLAAKENYRYDAHTKNYYRFLYLNQSIDQLLNETDLRLATYFPLALWNTLKEKTDTVTDDTVLKIILFQNDRLFVNHTVMERQPSDKVLDITIPNYSGDLPGDLPFIFNYTIHQNNFTNKPSCGFWNYSTWIDTGINSTYITNSKNNLMLCHTRHLSHFAVLLGIDFKLQHSAFDSAVLSILDDSALDLITVLGCGLSLFGLACIWLTAMCFESWRSKASNKVLLNMCFVLTLIMMLFLFLNMPNLRDSLIDMENSMECMIMGGFLQYNILTLFMWMLIIAFMQYQRYVQVLGIQRPSSFITKYALIAWGLPLIPTGLVAILDRQSYMPSVDRIRDNTAICYPTGNGLYYGVILPMGAVIIANLSIFLYIFWSLHRSLHKFQRSMDRKNIVTQIRLSVLLFFLLGISWIFGMLAYIDSSPVFSFIFCLTSTLQGFVLFIYFIVIDETARYSWLSCCYTKETEKTDFSHNISVNSGKN